MKILVTGATGYVGGRLAPTLVDAGHEVRCLVRNSKKLAAAPWRDRVEVVVGDLLEPASLGAAMEGVDTACYLVHSMGGGGSDFVERDRRAAINFRRAAARAGVRRIVYLGGLGGGADLSEHLASRQEVGRVLADGPVPVTELRAAVIIGSGSVSFEMVRYLTEVLPVMVTPAWVRTRCQPIAIADVLDILTHAVAEPGGDDHLYEIGGPDQLTYEEMMRVYAEVAGLPRRVIIPVPVLTPKLSSHWIGLVTPLPTGVAKPLVDSLRIEVTVADNSFAEAVSGPLLGYRASVVDALRRSQTFDIATRWSDAGSSPAQATPADPAWAGGATLVDTRSVPTGASADNLFWAFSRLGGTVGYYTMNWAWSVRGLLDSVLGGVGLRRGRRHPEELRPGEALDFWRVLDVERGRSLDLYAEMKLPGTAMLSFEAVPTPAGSELRQTAVFVPRGLVGRLYWWGLLPFHLAIFHRMARKIAAAAEARPDPLPRSRAGRPNRREHGGHERGSSTEGDRTEQGT
jgi:uncharacterized protein YbjT (DUF2867 family)